jgi:predicted enzyme related to lactoylglutathione lyase
VQRSEKNGVTVYFGTSDLDASFELVKPLGGSSEDAQDILSVGRYATCTDTEGNAFGLFEAKQT